MNETRQKDLVLRALANGATLSAIVASDGGPTRAQVLEWRHDDKAFAEGYQRALISAGSVFADRALQKATELAELGAAGRITPEAQRAMQSQIDALRWMAAHHDSRCYRAPGASGGTEAEADGGLVDNVQVHIYLPSNDRDGPLEGISDEERAAWRRERDELVSQRDRQLRGWVTLGRLTDEQASLARSLWAIEGDSAWVSPVPEPRQLWYCGPVVEAAQLVGNGAAPAMQETNGHGVSATKSEIEAAVGVVLMIARPNMTYQLSNGRAYTANWAGRLAARADDIGGLRAQGCRVG